MEIVFSIIAIIIVIAIASVITWNVIAKPYATNQAIDHALITLYEKGVLKQKDDDYVYFKRSRLNTLKKNIGALEHLILDTVYPDEFTKKVDGQEFRKRLKTVTRFEIHEAMKSRITSPVEDSRKRFSNLAYQDDSALFLGSLMFSSLNDSHSHGHTDSGGYDFSNYDSGGYSDGGSSGGGGGGGD